MRSKSLLLVDDSPEDVQLILHAMRNIVPREQVSICHSGEDALAHLGVSADCTAREAPILPSLVLLDFNLPRVTGLDGLRKIRAKAETRSLPVVMLSASVEQCDICAAMSAGANSYVRKCPDYARLQHGMTLLARCWLELNIEPCA